MQLEPQSCLLVAHLFIILGSIEGTFSLLWIFDPQKLLSGLFFWQICVSELHN